MTRESNDASRSRRPLLEGYAETPSRSKRGAAPFSDLLSSDKLSTQEPGEPGFAVEIETTHAPKLLVLRFRDQWPTLEQQRALRQQLRADAHLTESTRALIDIRGVDVPDERAAGAMIDAAVQDGGLPSACAYLVASAVQFGFGLQLQSLAPATTRSEIFAHERDALMWLHHPSLRTGSVQEGCLIKD